MSIVNRRTGLENDVCPRPSVLELRTNGGISSVAAYITIGAVISRSHNIFVLDWINIRDSMGVYYNIYVRLMTILGIFYLSSTFKPFRFKFNWISLVTFYFIHLFVSRKSELASRIFKHSINFQGLTIQVYSH